MHAHSFSQLPMIADKKIAVVTGAGSGIGRVTAQALLREGYAVALAGRRLDALQETANQVAGTGEALVVPTDVTVYGQVEALVERAATTLGRLDIVVNNSGVAAIIPVAEMPPEIHMASPASTAW